MCSCSIKPQVDIRDLIQISVFDTEWESWWFAGQYMVRHNLRVARSPQPTTSRIGRARAVKDTGCGEPGLT